VARRTGGQDGDTHVSQTPASCSSRPHPYIAARTFCLVAALSVCRPSISADAHRLLDAVAALEAGRLADALEAAKAVAHSDPRSPLALDVRAMAELLMYDVAGAQESFEAAHRLQRDDPCALLGLGGCAAAESRWDVAIVAYERALARECEEPAVARTSLAFVTLAAGDAAAALEHVRQARRGGVPGPLLDQVASAAHMALGDAGAAEMALRRSAAVAVPITDAVLTPLHVRPPAEPAALALAREPAPLPPQYALGARPAVAPPGSHEPKTDGPVAITSPTDGAAVSDTVHVQIGGAARDRLSYVVLLVDAKFRAVRNVVPFRLALDTKTCSDGAHSLEVKGYDRSGALLGGDAVTVFVNNGVRRTVDPAAVELRRQVARRLERCIALRPHPLNQPYLMGRILGRQGRLADAIAAFEYVFSVQPMFASVHTRLTDAYGRLGVLAGSDRARIIRELPRGKHHVALTFGAGLPLLLTQRPIRAQYHRDRARVGQDQSPRA